MTRCPMCERHPSLRVIPGDRWLKQVAPKIRLATESSLALAPLCPPQLNTHLLSDEIVILDFRFAIETPADEVCGERVW